MAYVELGGRFAAGSGITDEVQRRADRWDGRLLHNVSEVRRSRC